MLSLAYLLLPSLLFIAGYLRAYISVVLIAALLAVIGIMVCQVNNRSCSLCEKEATLPKHFIPLMVIAVGWCLLCGIGGVSHQTGDYMKHTGLASDLVNLSWPVRYQIGDVTQPLVYYFGYYLPGALAAKVFGLELSSFFQLVYSSLGVYLVFLWINRILGKSAILPILVFAFFGGLDIIGNVMVNGSFVDGLQDIDYWAGIWQYSSVATQLCWVPQHAIAGWLATSMIVHEIMYMKDIRNIFMIASCAIFWSPFVFAGLLPIVAAAFLVTMKRNMRHVFSLQNIVFPLIFGLLFGVYFLSGNGENPHSFLWKSENLFSIWPRLLLFELLSFGVFVLCVRRIPTSFKHVFVAAVASLVLIPFFRYGIWNDFAMRASIPGLFIVFLSFSMQLFGTKEEEHLQEHNPNHEIKPQSSSGLSYEKRVLIMLLIVAAISSSVNYTRALNNPHQRFDTKSLAELPEPYFRQYVGDSHSIFFTYLAKKR